MFEDSVFTSLKNNQAKPLVNQTTSGVRSSGLGSLSITPISSGHMLGGTMWRIIKDDEQHILYAVNYSSGALYGGSAIWRTTYMADYFWRFWAFFDDFWRF